jgi:prefoldin subunit 5
MSKVTLSMVYKEIKKLNKRIEFIEELVEEIIVNELPKIKLSKEEVEEIKNSLEEMKKGNYVTLKELMNA